MKLKGMIFMEGDIVTFKNGSSMAVGRDNYLDLERLEEYIVKIERPVKYETIYEKEILDDVEKEYLKNIIKPFRKRIISIVKLYNCNGNFIRINLRNMENDFLEKIIFPYFRKDTMYNGMKLRKEYTLEELGL